MTFLQSPKVRERERVLRQIRANDTEERGSEDLLAMLRRNLSILRNEKYQRWLRNGDKGEIRVFF